MNRVRKAWMIENGQFAGPHIRAISVPVMSVLLVKRPLLGHRSFCGFFWR